jgi:hypothetical protein
MGCTNRTTLGLYLACLALPLVCAACQEQRPPAARLAVELTGLAGPESVAAVAAECAPPWGWIAQPAESSRQHAQELWVSPTGDTAYGVIQMHLPFPLSGGLVLWAFLNEMRRRQGEAQLLARSDDPALPGLRFVAEGGEFKLRANLILRGSSAWAIYAGTRRSRPENHAELALAERAREATNVGN